MANGQVDITVDRPADEVWKLVGDFGGLGDWMPGIESCRVEGDNRVLAMGGMEITETLVKKDDDARTLVYSITNGVPVERHQTTITVEPQGDGSHVLWGFEVEPENLAPLFEQTYGGAIKALKQQAEGA